MKILVFGGPRLPILRGAKYKVKTDAAGREVMDSKRRVLVEMDGEGRPVMEDAQMFTYVEFIDGPLKGRETRAYPGDTTPFDWIRNADGFVSDGFARVEEVPGEVDEPPVKAPHVAPAAPITPITKVTDKK